MDQSASSVARSFHCAPTISCCAAMGHIVAQPQQGRVGQMVPSLHSFRACGSVQK